MTYSLILWIISWTLLGEGRAARMGTEFATSGKPETHLFLRWRPPNQRQSDGEQLQHSSARFYIRGHLWNEDADLQKITLHSWKELWELPLSIWLRGRNTPRCTSFVLGARFDVQVTGGVSCDRFDVELLDFIVTSMPTRRAVSHLSHLNKDVSLRYPFYKHQSLNTCFHIPADRHTICAGGRAVLK